MTRPLFVGGRLNDSIPGPRRNMPLPRCRHVDGSAGAERGPTNSGKAHFVSTSSRTDGALSSGHTLDNGVCGYGHRNASYAKLRPRLRCCKDRPDHAVIYIPSPLFCSSLVRGQLGKAVATANFVHDRGPEAGCAEAIGNLARGVLSARNAIVSAPVRPLL
jgi:hypothetical protein